MKHPKYIIGDSRNLKEIFNKNSIDSPQLIITSPPYHDIKDYGDTKNQIGPGQSYSDFLKDTINVLQLCYEVSEPNSTLWVITDSVKKNGELIPLTFDLNRKLRESESETWKLKEIIIWDKTKSLPWNAKGRLKNQFEYISFYVKNDNYKFNVDKVRDIFDLKKWWLTYPERYNPKGKPPSNIWEFITPIRGWGNGYLNHLCPFPFPLVERIISISSSANDLVFDPFAGSGSVLAMAHMMGRGAVGIDLNKKYRERFVSEALVGAKKYWENRKNKLEKAKKKINEFKLLNNKLRKNKLSSLLVEKIKLISNRANEFDFLAIEDKKDKRKINFYLVGEPKINLDIITKSDSIKSLVKTYGINVNFKRLSPKFFLNHLGSKKLFSYKYNNTHKYISEIETNKINEVRNKSGYFYSDIRINIEKPEDFFKQF